MINHKYSPVDKHIRTCIQRVATGPELSKNLTRSEVHPNVQLDELTKVTCNANSCEENLFNKNGLGQGRNYGSTYELPNMYNHYYESMKMY